MAIVSRSPPPHLRRALAERNKVRESQFRQRGRDFVQVVHMFQWWVLGVISGKAKRLSRKGLPRDPCLCSLRSLPPRAWSCTFSIMHPRRNKRHNKQHGSIVSNSGRQQYPAEIQPAYTRACRTSVVKTPPCYPPPNGMIDNMGALCPPILVQFKLFFLIYQEGRTYKTSFLFVLNPYCMYVCKQPPLIFHSRVVSSREVLRPWMSSAHCRLPIVS